MILKGDLIYVPAGVRLSSSPDNAGAYPPQNWLYTDIPVNLLVLRKLECGLLEVYFRGSSWFLNEKHVYRSKELNK
tara:strand:- start:462 stop:689 length:228 start_codon:yes stop_codon:yes gene_type:complete